MYLLPKKKKSLYVLVFLSFSAKQQNVSKKKKSRKECVFCGGTGIGDRELYSLKCPFVN